MNTHYCKVGTVRHNLNKILKPDELENNTIKIISKKDSSNVDEKTV